MTAVQIWAKWINSKGGLNGHPIAVSTVDDGSDPARHRAALQDLVEKTGVVAFVGNVSVFGMQQGSIDYLTGKRVPVVGGDRLNESWYSSPMLFPQASAGTAILWTQMVDVAVTVGKGTKVGFISCQELQMCRDALTHWPGYARQNGLDPVYSAQVSLTQPNFTAECLAAQRAGVKVLQVGMDNNSTRRIASNCAQQGFKPVFSLVGASLDMPNEPGLDQALFTSEVFPWVADDTPAAQEFRQVMAAQAPNLPLSFDLASGWVAAKLLEKAAARIGDNPTSAEVLEGLWALQGDNLGGLTGPLTFARDQKAPPLFCLWVMRIEAKRWAAPQGSRAVCQPRP
jgi:branched-chain amino acid transport system substrate-binding protein